MQSILSRFRESSREFRSVRTLTFTSLLLALKFVLDTYNIRIVITENLRITFGFLALAFIGLLFGPVVGMTAGFISDLIGFMLNNGGGSYFPGYTLTAILGGLIWGLMLYKKPIRVWRFIVAKTTINLFLNLGLNTYWGYLMRGNGALADFPLRIFKNIAMIPIEALLLYGLVRALYPVYKQVIAYN